MTNKSNVLIFSGVSLILGLILGYVIFSTGKDIKTPLDMHIMSDGQVMKNDHMDMGDAMSGMMSGLEGKTGDEFDKAFLSEMIVHHQGAVDMANEVLKTSKRPELLRLAKDIISAQTKEIYMMQNWQKNWFSN